MRQSRNIALTLDGSDSFTRIQGLIFGRLALIFLLLLASWWWTASYLQHSEGPVPIGLFLFFLVSIGLTGAYNIAAYFDHHYLIQRKVQFFVDVLLITWLVWETGDVRSAYVSLYIVLICLSGFLLGRVETLAITFGSAVCFVALSILTGQAILYSQASDVPISRSLQLVAFNTIAILFVGLMAARIADRKLIGEELRESRESFADLNILYERLVQSIDTGLITTDLEGRIFGFNRAAEKISGCSESDVAGRHVVDVCGRQFEQHLNSVLAAIRISGPERIDEHFEAQFPVIGVRSITVVCTISPLFRRNDEISGLIITIQDISRIRSLEVSLRRADRLAAVGRMAAGLAHEIRNPLGSLGSSLQFLRGRVPADSSEAALFDVVLRESERLNGIITNFLSYARPASNALEKTQNKETDIDAALRDCLLLMKHDPKVKDWHQFKYERPREEVRSSISETHIKQVMWNLLQNSIKAMPNGGDITVDVNKFPGGRVQMLFQDTGSGFTPENLEHLYEPFSVAAAGTGLGLSIVHKIVKENGGRIDIGSTNGKGTKIVVELPS